MSAINALLDVMKQLRDPQSGCAWDIQQTFETIAPYTIEEAYEVADAIERDDLDDLRDELGDLLLQVVFHSQMAAEQGAFEFDDVAQSITDKMLRRHPHVFGDASISDTAELKAAWEAEKARERARKNTEDASALAGIARSLPALKLADKVQKRAARVGFDWPESSSVWDKLTEEIDEVKEAIASGNGSGNQQAVEDEFGDLLFTVVNLARHHGVDSESALRGATRKFENRFRCVEKLAARQHSEMSAMNIVELDALWDQAKAGMASTDAKN